LQLPLHLQQLALSLHVLPLELSEALRRKPQGKRTQTVDNFKPVDESKDLPPSSHRSFLRPASLRLFCVGGKAREHGGSANRWLRFSDRIWN
jgi:hypothetical protein